MAAIDRLFGFSSPAETSEQRVSLPADLQAFMADFFRAVESKGNADLKAKMTEWDAEVGAIDALPVPDELLDALFAPNPELEQLIAAPLRGNNLKLLEPESGLTWPGGEQTLRFNEAATNKTLRFSIVNNEDVELRSGELPVDADGSVRFNAAIASPGRYYLKIISNDSLVVLAFQLARG